MGDPGLGFLQLGASLGPVFSPVLALVLRPLLRLLLRWVPGLRSPRSRSIMVVEMSGLDEDDLDCGWKKIPAGRPSGLWMTRPEAALPPSFFTAVSEKYSSPSGNASGDVEGSELNESELVRE